MTALIEAFDSYLETCRHSHHGCPSCTGCSNERRALQALVQALREREVKRLEEEAWRTPDPDGSRW